MTDYYKKISSNERRFLNEQSNKIFTLRIIRCHWTKLLNCVHCKDNDNKKHIDAMLQKITDVTIQIKSTQYSPKSFLDDVVEWHCKIYELMLNSRSMFAKFDHLELCDTLMTFEDVTDSVGNFNEKFEPLELLLKDEDKDKKPQNDC